LKGSGIRNAAKEHGYVYTSEAPYEVLANNYIDYKDIRRLHILEDVFNVTYNSGRFSATLRLLTDAIFKQDAFRLFCSLAAYWEQQEMDMVSHSPKAVYNFVSDYCCSAYPAHAGIILNFLKFDALYNDDKKVRPEFLPWSDNDMLTKDNISRFWRDEKLVKYYLPDFKFTSWREVNQNYHIESFSINIPHYLKTGEILHQDTLLLFDYRSAKPTYMHISLAGGHRNAL
jgi:hypothetical protein